MTATETMQSKRPSRAIHGFSVLKMKEEIQAKKYRETKDMTTEEHLEYIHQGAERFRREGEELCVRKAVLKTNPRGMILMMVMVMMALLATLVMSFLIMVSQTRIPEGTETGGSGSARDSRIANLRKEALMQLLRGPDANALGKSVIGPHSILENLYGQPTGGWDPTLNAGAGGVIDYLHAPAILVTVTRNPTTGFIEAEIPATVLFNTAVPSPPINPLSLMGTVITIHKDSVVLPPFEKFKNSSMRIVSVNDDGTGNIVMTIVPPTGMPPTDVGNFVTALNTCDLIINGAPFSGTGIGFEQPIPSAPGERLTLKDGGDVGGGGTVNPIESILRPNPLAPAELSGLPSGILSSRVAVPAPAVLPATEPTPNLLQEYVYSLRYGFTSANPDYTAADLNTMFLARQDILSGTGQVTAIIPSFHRPKLVEDFVTAGGTSWEILRKLVLRPLPYDNPDFTGGTPELELQAGWTDALACATILAKPPMTAGAAYDVDNDGDGVAESYWLDIGLTPITFPGSTTKYKPLVAYLVLDLDGRIDVNAHSFGTPALTGGGRGPAEIVASVPTKTGRSVDERYALTGISNDLFTTPFSYLANALYSAYLPRGAATGATPIGSAADIDTLFRGSLPDLWGNVLSAQFDQNNPSASYDPTTSALDKLGQRLFPTTDLTYNDALDRLVDGTRTNPYLYNPNPADNEWKIGTTPGPAFKLPQLTSLLSSRDTDGTRLPKELREILFDDQRYPDTTKTANPKEHYLRNWLTGITADIPSPPMSIGDDLSIYDRIWRIVTINLASPTSDDAARFWAVYNALPVDIRAGRKININATVTLHTVEEKARFAQSLFVLLCVICDDEIQAYVTGGDFTGVAAVDKTQYTYQRLAQWCVNIVDFSDADEIMTPFVIPTAPTRTVLFQSPVVAGKPAIAWLGNPIDYSIAINATANVGNHNYTEKLLHSSPTVNPGQVIWGLERSNIVITETLAFHDQGTSTGSAFVELYNASNPTAPDLGRGGQVNLAATVGSDNVWRLAIGAEIDPSKGPAALTDTDILGDYQGTNAKDASTPFQPSGTVSVINFTAAPSSFLPNEYLVIGPRLETKIDPASASIDTTLDPADPTDSVAITDEVIRDDIIHFDRLVDPASTQVKTPHTMIETTLASLGLPSTPTNDRYPFFKPVFLQRLADTSQPHNPVSNPYITVDWSVFDLTVYDSSDDGTGSKTRDSASGQKLASRQWGRSPASVEELNLWSRQVNDGDFPTQGGVSIQKNSADIIPTLKKWVSGTTDFKDATFTLGFLNSYGSFTAATDEPTADSTTVNGASPATYHGRPPEPFSYLHWNDAPFASSLEALQVPASSPGRFGLEFDPEAAKDICVTSGTGSLGLNGQTTHLLNFFHSDDTLGNSLNLGKFFDYVALPSLFAGTVDPITGQPRYREPGKVNLNTMNEKTYEALKGSRSAMADFPGPTDVSKVQGSRNDQPFRAVDAWNRVADATLLPSAPVVATMLRSDGTADPLFSKVPSASNTQQALESLQRLSEMTTTRSNTFAVWVTIGLFAVEGDTDGSGNVVPITEDPSNPGVTKWPATLPAQYSHLATPYANYAYFLAVHPDGYFLGAERGSSGTEKLERFRNLYIIDRTIPVGFRRGMDYNVRDTVVYPPKDDQGLQ